MPFFDQREPISLTPIETVGNNATISNNNDSSSTNIENESLVDGKGPHNQESNTDLLNETEQDRVFEELYRQEIGKSAEASNQESPSSSPNRDIPKQQKQILVGNFTNAAQILQKVDSSIATSRQETISDCHSI